MSYCWNQCVIIHFKATEEVHQLQKKLKSMTGHPQIDSTHMCHACGERPSGSQVNKVGKIHIK